MTPATHQQSAERLDRALESPSQTPNSRSDRNPGCSADPMLLAEQPAARRWPAALSDHARLFAIQPPGREERLGEPPFTELEPLLAELIPRLLPYLDAPFAFFRSHMGALQVH